MNRRRLVRWQILMLFVVAALLVARVLTGPPMPEGLVVFTDLEEGQLRHAAFRVDEGATLALEATGSFEKTETPSLLAAYAWILRRDTRGVVWQMTPTTVRHGKGTLAHATDTLSLAAGTYDVFFTTYGPTPDARHNGSFLNLQHHWVHDGKEWIFVLRPADPTTAARVFPLSDESWKEHLTPFSGQRIWSSAPATNADRTDEQFLFQVNAPVTLHLYAVGEFCDQDGCDYGWIEDALTHRRHWQMTWDNTEAGGGWVANRRFRGDLPLEPGLYRAVFRTDRGHGYHAWEANPPFDPAGWGLTITTDTPSALTAFDPWVIRTPLIRLTEVPNDEHRSTQFVVEQPLRVIIYALGEITSSGNRYDYGWLENNATGERVWEMTYEASQPEEENPGSNRFELAFLDLKPATYTLYFNTDNSHAFGDWRNGPPAHPERWGVTLFPFADTLAEDAVRILSPSLPPLAKVPSGPLPPLPPPGTGDVLFKRIRLGNNVDFEAPLHLDEPTLLRIYALGELTSYDRYDYGQIKRADTGETVWEMTLQNTMPAGGHENNRRFDGTLRLPAGDYMVYFRTDGSHAYGDFNGEGPENPAAWGISIERIPE